MRRMMLVALILLGGCSAARDAAGQIQTIADKGIGIQPAAPTESVGPAEPAAPGDPIKALPGSLGGDSEHPAYAPPPPRFS